MEAPPQRRDINELLTTGYFKTSRGKSPSGFVIASSPSSLLMFALEPPLLRATRRPTSQPPTMSLAPVVEAVVMALADGCLHYRS
jgi:hypothetical protein